MQGHKYLDDLRSNTGLKRFLRIVSRWADKAVTGLIFPILAASVTAYVTVKLMNLGQ
jgi:hypothetical protein